MAYQQPQGEERKMFQGEWPCSGCNGKITQLPFEPDANRLNQLLCKDCYRARRQSQFGR